jgi:hypothetical protein
VIELGIIIWVYYPEYQGDHKGVFKGDSGMSGREIRNCDSAEFEDRGSPN